MSWRDKRILWFRFRVGCVLPAALSAPRHAIHSDMPQKQMRWKHLAHTYLWQNVPRGLRRQLLFHVTARLAPRPTPHAPGRSPIIVAGFLRTASGLGEGARLCHEALSQCGHDVYGIDLTEFFRQPGPVVPYSFRDGRCLKGPGTLVLHVNGPFVPLALMRLGKRLVTGKRIIGYWAWELPKVPPEWRFGVPFVHEIWVPSRFTASAIGAIAGEVPVRVIPHPVAVRNVRAAEAHRPRRGPFTALVVFNMASGFSRKNPLAAIEAFKRAFGNDPACQLVVRVVNADLYPAGHKALAAAVASLTNAQISDGKAGATSVDELYASADVVLSLHRSEGFGLVIAEAMLHGLPVVATNWSGNLDFLTNDNGLPISYSLVPAHDPQGTYDQPSCFWAEADVGAAAAKLRMIRGSRAIAVAIGKQAAIDASSIFGAEMYIQRVRELLGASLCAH
jgi:glycosyltransferase involved in cell wall biosynthesis